MSSPPHPGGRGNRSAFNNCLRFFGLVVSAFFFGAFLGVLMRSAGVTGATPHDRQDEYRHELHTYVYGYILALGLTLVPFGLVYSSGMAASGLYLAIGAFAIVQAIVHFRCFLHIDPPRQNTDDLHLILFSSLLLLFMVGGTIWILANLAARMH